MGEGVCVIDFETGFPFDVHNDTFFSGLPSQLGLMSLFCFS